MHDIICPKCGERFIARDVAFDISEYITPLLYDNLRNEQTVRDANFKYYIDEDAILKNPSDNNTGKLFCSSLMGPDRNDAWYTLNVTNEMLWDYISQKEGAGFDVEEFIISFTDKLKAPAGGEGRKNAKSEEHPGGGEGRNNNARNAEKAFKPEDRRKGEIVYKMFFENKNLRNFDLNDERFQTAMNILRYIHDNLQHEMTLQVSVYTSQKTYKSSYAVPDTMFINDAGNVVTIQKCCRYCGWELPMEFGYYPIKPVILLGSHYAGKTSYLLSMLFTIQNKQPFVGAELRCDTLTNDSELDAFMKNLEVFMGGGVPEKTDFSNVPILNIKVKDTIYSFIDWPGEQFINEDNRPGKDYVFKDKRVLKYARHCMFFLAPSQVNVRLQGERENVGYPVMYLRDSLAFHLNLTDKRRLGSIVYVVNKVDMLLNDSNIRCEELKRIIDTTTEATIFNGKTINKDMLQRLMDSTSSFVQSQNQMLYNTLDNINLGEYKIKKYYAPVAPYGKDMTNANSNEGNLMARDVAVMDTVLSGVPLLMILKEDKLIK